MNGRDQSPGVPARQRPGEGVAATVSPAKYSCVAKKPAMAVQSRNTPKPIANLRPSDARRPMPESICEAGVVANLTATFVHS